MFFQYCLVSDFFGVQANHHHIASFTDETAWKELKCGNKCAFEFLYQKYVNLLYDYGSKLTSDQKLVEDCLQELFADLWQKRVQFGEVKSTKYYLLVALKRRIFRSLTSRKEFTVFSEYTFDAVLSVDARGLPTRLSEERICQLRRAFVKLTSKQKEVIYLRYYNQLSFEEIADIMDVQVKTVYKLLYRALDTLRKYTPREHYLWCLLF